jgi:hypothetical protein
VEVVWSRTFESLFRAHDDDLASARNLKNGTGRQQDLSLDPLLMRLCLDLAQSVVRRWISPASRYILASLAVQIIIHYPWRWPNASSVLCRMSTCGVSQERGAEAKRLFRQASSNVT